ncbi:LpxL/LpxP family Kdo(2)-lipid IV(A) lauroyl/palmitoleoyl acyltransferase [Alcanivorax sp. JB21]|uniref:LpxL/LpxP family Kdo(2)-lipid IV(A) lauroyl/palmitoleoyl acyltransferase n=1 Tax=Alcanivorax limicola TaxID=2874102 RepID=UPI001CBC2BCD|nr:LpxL/LpxP family Kdo(2)-lipid IV(A) lauroyl/palmitoleoyl acyltransferase [Alcanivorax limicola]MBZ2190291.1 LpxL/LpxP family Kdo(2)-lipid IV(A) lauroyl/palmitoleoyl acyltransferase [Alcanivorax limicola]
MTSQTPQTPQTPEPSASDKPSRPGTARPSAARPNAARPNAARQKRKAGDDTSLAHPRYWGSWLMVALIWVIGQLPWNILLKLGRGVGALVWRIGGTRRDIALTNIRLCFPELSDAEQLALARRTIISTGEAMLEIAGAYANRRVDLHARLEFEGLAHLRAVQQEGKGVLLVGMHLNSIDVGSRLIPAYTEFCSVYRPNNNPVLERMISRGRGGRGTDATVKAYIDRKDIRGMVRALRRGDTVWYAPDQDYGLQHAVFAPFFGVPAATITATSRLARMTGARVLTISHFRLPGGRYRISVGEPLADFPSGDELADTARINALIEAEVRKAPEQYLWVHRRFKHQPDGSNPYKKKAD